MNYVIMNVGLIRCTFKPMNSIYGSVNCMIIDIGLKLYILNSINSIIQFHELRDYNYWTYMIYLKFKL